MKPLFTTIALFVCSLAAQASTAAPTTFTFAPGQSGESWSNSATNSGILTLSFGSMGTVTLTGYSCPQTLCASTPTRAENQLTYGLTDNTGAVGVATGSTGTESQIPRSDFVTIDFSNLHANVASVTINTTKVVDGWDIYTTNVQNEFDSTSGGPVAQGNNGVAISLSSYPNINSTITAPVGGLSSGSSTFALNSKYLTVSALQADCETEISGISVTFATPEPASCFLAGFTLLGLGLAGRKLRRRV